MPPFIQGGRRFRERRGSYSRSVSSALAPIAVRNDRVMLVHCATMTDPGATLHAWLP